MATERFKPKTMVFGWVIFQATSSLVAEAPSAIPVPQTKPAPAAQWFSFRGSVQGGVADSEPSGDVIAWKQQIGQSVWSSPVAAGDSILIAGDVGRLFKFRASDGHWEWSRAIGSGCTATPVVHGGRVIVGTRDGNLVACDLKHGSILWSVGAGGLIHASAAISLNPPELIFGDTTGAMVGMSLGGDKPLWRRANGVPIVSSPVVHESVLYAAAGQAVFAIDLKNHKEKWMQIFKSVIRTGLTFSEEKVVFGAGDGKLTALNANDGKLRWTFQAKDALESTPAIRDEVVYFGSHDGKIRAVTLRDGKLQWEARTDGRVNSSPAVSKDHVVVGSWDGQVYCLNRSDGTVRWRTRLGGPIASSPIVVGSVTVVACNDGYVYGLN